MSNKPNEPQKDYKSKNRDSIALYLFSNKVPYNPNLPTEKLEEIAKSFKAGEPLPHQPKKAGEQGGVGQEVYAQLAALSARIAALEANEVDLTKDDLADFATKDELEGLATKADLEAAKTTS